MYIAHIYLVSVREMVLDWFVHEIWIIFKKRKTQGVGYTETAAAPAAAGGDGGNTNSQHADTKVIYT